MPELEIEVLKNLAIRGAGTPRTLPKSKQARALLVYLLLNPGARRREHLCGLLWESASDPRAGLRWSLAKLRPLLATTAGNALVSNRDSVGLDRTLLTLDLDRAEALIADEAAGVEALRLAESSFGDHPLPGLDQEGATEFQLWLESARQRIGGLHQRLLIRLAEAPSNDAADALQAARKAVGLDPYDIRANATLLRLTHASAGRSKAREVLDAARQRWEDAGIDTRALFETWQALGGIPARAPAATDETVPAERPPIDALGKPSIAILGFAGMGADPHGDIFAEGLSSDLSSAMAQVRGLFVIARASAGRFSPAQYSMSEIGRRLGVRYLLHGSTRRQDRRLRVTVELVETERGALVWSEHFDRSLDDLFAVQDDITGAVISALIPEIERAEMERARLKPPESLDAWECYHRALWHSFRFTVRDTQIASGLLSRALEHDPNFARAYAGLSFAHFSRVFLDNARDVASEVARALETAETCVGLDGRDAMGHWALGRARFLAREHDQALAAIERSLEVNPNYAQGHYARGFVGVHAGLPDLAVSELEIAQRLSPFDPLLFAIKSSRGISFAVQERFDEAAAWAVRATQEPNAHFHIHAIAGACLALAGRESEARRMIDVVRKKHPGYSLATFERSFPHKLEAHRRIMREALEKAGLPEG